MLGICRCRDQLTDNCSYDTNFDREMAVQRQHPRSRTGVEVAKTATFAVCPAVPAIESSAHSGPIGRLRPATVVVVDPVRQYHVLRNVRHYPHYRPRTHHHACNSRGASAGAAKVALSINHHFYALR